MPDKVRIALILEALPGPVDGWVRLRRALKALLRAYGLRNRLFIDPKTLEANKAAWREVEPVDGFDASKSEPPF